MYPYLNGIVTFQYDCLFNRQIATCQTHPRHYMFLMNTRCFSLKKKLDMVTVRNTNIHVCVGNNRILNCFVPLQKFNIPTCEKKLSQMEIGVN